PCFNSRSRAISGTYPDPAATSRRDSDDPSISRATRRIIPSVVEIPPNQRLIRRRSPSEAVISAGVPESVSSSSVVTTRLIGRTSRRSSVTSCQQVITYTLLLTTDDCFYTSASSSSSNCLL